VRWANVEALSGPYCERYHEMHEVFSCVQFLSMALFGFVSEAVLCFDEVARWI